MPRSSPRLSGTLFAYVIPRMMKFPPLVVAGGTGAAGDLRRRLLKADGPPLFQGPPLFRSRFRWEQLIDGAAVHQVGADQTGEGERAFDGVLGGLGETQQHEGDRAT